MIFLFFLFIEILLAFRKLQISHTQSALYKNYIIFNQNNAIAYSSIQDLNQFSIISEDMNEFCLQNDFLAVWNRDIIIMYTLQEENENTINVAESFNIKNENFINITISSFYFIAQFRNRSLYVHNLLSQNTRILDFTKIEQQNSSPKYIEVYKYDSNLTFTYLNSDNKFHINYQNENNLQYEEKVWMSIQTDLFSAQYWENGTAIFMNSDYVNYTIPIQVLFWHVYDDDLLEFLSNRKYDQNSKINIKYLYSIQDTYVFAIFTNKGICYQYYSQSIQINYGNILCMKIEDEQYQLYDVNFNQGLQLLLRNNQTNELAIDYYNQCLLYSINPIKNSCSLCLKEYCFNECHSIKSYQCNDNKIYKLSWTFMLIFLLIGFIFSLIIYCITQILECFIQLKQFLQFIGGKLSKFLNIRMQQLKKKLYQKFKRILAQSKNNTCPICLEDVIDARFFPCQNHTACYVCFREYNNNQQMTCPFRDV
ncbi:unnamed protein product [Paramecium sonneborni]|uniref:RING-type domain-containing protein n=1 Tax=Paramecium sonneborni TaxID=65129 RepID=A0A8S1QAB1_9CILI|nr:unnamed protein product [Paramecium sonneborni]